MAKGNYIPNVKHIRSVKMVKVEKFISAFTGGKGADIDDGREHIAIPEIPGLDPSCHTILDVTGDSMAPLICEGDMLIVDTTNIRPKKGSIVALMLNGDLMIKIFDPGAVCLHLTSINQNHEPIRVYEYDECVIIGVAWKVLKDAVI